MYFAGLDAHLKYVTVAVLDRLGTIVLETTVSTREPERLLAVLAPFRPLEVVVETCPFWPWLYDLLVPAGIGFHLAHAKRLRAIATAPQKNDRVDARLLARMLLSGLIPEAYPRAGDQRELLRLLRHRTTLVRFRTRLAGRIHAPAAAPAPAGTAAAPAAACAFTTAGVHSTSCPESAQSPRRCHRDATTAMLRIACLFGSYRQHIAVQQHEVRLPLSIQRFEARHTATMRAPT